MLKKLLQYIEIKTKITCVLPFLMTLSYLFFLRQPVNWGLTAVFFFSMLCIDLAVTAINNYIDSRDYPEMLPLKRPAALAILLFLLILGIGLGLYLALATDVVVLIMGALCVLGGVLYTYGPVPISRQPLGELFSGILEGVFIPFLILYINMPGDTYLTLRLSAASVDLSLHPMPLVTVTLLTVLPALATANIMLANNTCDIRKDIAVNRYTLPFHLGRRRAVRLFGQLYYIAILVPSAMALSGLLPLSCLLLLALLPIVSRHIAQFRQEQKKETTFLVAIKNYVLLVGGYTVCLFLGGILARL